MGSSYLVLTSFGVSHLRSCLTWREMTLMRPFGSANGWPIEQRLSASGRAKCRASVSQTEIWEYLNIWAHVLRRWETDKKNNQSTSVSIDVNKQNIHDDGSITCRFPHSANLSTSLTSEKVRTWYLSGLYFWIQSSGICFYKPIWTNVSSVKYQTDALFG